MGQEPAGRDQEALTVAALDLGSNTLKLTVADVAPGAPLSVRFEDAIISRIGEGLDQHGHLQDAAIERTMIALHRLRSAAQAHGATLIRCVGTAGLRGADNAAAFLSRVRSETGIEVEIIDGLREAELAFRAPSETFGPGPILAIDLGGRSTELIAGRRGRIDARVSLEVGSVRLTERCLPSDPPTDAELDRARADFRALLGSAPEASPGAALVGVSGTVVALLGLQEGIEDAAEIAGLAERHLLRRDDVAGFFEVFRRLRARDRIRGTIIPEGRADVIVAGMLIVLELFRHYGAETMRVTGRGVRYGLLHEIGDR
ncbi:MAG: hypothetical protein IT384_04680 [Deltaproteobacteria bacterium]|nr:hypothetical protein [Deltaproteobacteria bacterium]